MVLRHASLVRQVAQLERQVFARRRELPRAAGRFARALGNALTSPVALATAVAVGFMCERHGALRAGRRERLPETGHHAGGLFQRIVIVTTVIRSWGPLLQLLDGWFRRRTQYDAQVPRSTLARPAR